MKKEDYQSFTDQLGKNVTLVAVSKVQPVEKINQLYQFGQRDFGENYVQELIEKQLLLPDDLRWHFIGHLQSNKIKYIAPFIHLIHSVDSYKLLLEIDRQGRKFGRKINCLLQVHIASEETKFGLHENELDEMVESITHAAEVNELGNIMVQGLMGMASFSEDEDKVRAEMRNLSTFYDKYRHVNTKNFMFKYLSMGMSADYKMAIEEGSNMVRIGSLLFGERPKSSV
ncbi:MAG TPA: YggS family pyridoxal phosphate-dependent enzyme [Flavitalea sp.]|nr:YggS family pyridoxal phosphate-dependent enzyme [Flavitalea sp.]